MDKARKFLDQGDWAKAFAEARTLLENAPQTWEALEPVVLGLYGFGRLRESMELLQAQLRRNPQDASALNALGCVAQEMGAQQSSVEIFRRSVQQDPSFPAALANLGAASRAQGRTAEGAACLKKAQALDPLDVRIERLSLLSIQPADAEAPPAAAWQSRGQVFPVYSPVRASVRHGCSVQLTGVREDAWELKMEPVEGALPLLPEGHLIASVWNQAGLFLKEGKLEWSPSESGRFVALLRGAQVSWIQRRQYFRILSGEFLQAELRGTASRKSEIRDFSAGGLSFFSQDPPDVGSMHAWKVRFSGEDVEIPGVVRGVRASVSGRPVVGVEFLIPERQVDRLARAVHNHVRRLHSFKGLANH